MILRNFISTLRRYKVSSLLNIIGLGVAFASFYLIMVQVHHDLTYNQSLPDSERIYKLSVKHNPEEALFTNIHSRIATERIGKQLPQVENYFTKTRTMFYLFTSDKGERIDFDSDTQVTSVSDDVIDFLSLEIVAGSTDALFVENSNNIIIAQSIAEARNLWVGDNIYSGNSSEKITTLNIIGIFKDIPQSNDFSDLKILNYLGELHKDNKYGHMYEYFYKLRKDANPKEVEKLATDIFVQTNNELWGEKHDSKAIAQLTSIKDTYFSDNTEGWSGNSSTGDKQVTYTLILIASIIILIALINFINFFFALVPIRIRAVNARKIFGCSRTNLVINFIGEAIGLVVCALGVAVIIAEGLKDSFVTDYISTSTAFSENLDLVIAVVIFCLIISIVVALYPALYITKFKPAMMIKSGFAFSKSGKILRSTLIGVQFITSIVLLSCATFMQIQYDFMMNYDMGIETENIISSIIHSKNIGSTESNRSSFIELLKKNSDIVDVTFSSNSVVSTSRSSSFFRTEDIELESETYYVYPNFLDFMGIELIEGEGFKGANGVPVNNSIIMNEKTRQVVGSDETMDNLLKMMNTDFRGYCKDFNFKSLKKEITPLTFKVDLTFPILSFCYIKHRAGADVPSVIKYIKECIGELDPSFYQGLLEFETVDDQIAALYGDERKQSNLILIFTVISIIISLMGVFGLVMFEAQLRQQEIVIRRVHGATVKEILLMINRKFLIIIGVCFAVGVPISYYLMDGWLSIFAYRIDISAWVFVAVLVIITLITTLVVTVQSYKAANSNPADLISKNS